MSYLSDGDNPRQSVQPDSSEETEEDTNDGFEANGDFDEAMEVENQAPEELVLQPLSESELNLEKERKRQQKRKKLLWDEATTITGEEMKMNLSDYYDTLQALELAPPTKRLMLVKETGQSDRIYSAMATGLSESAEILKVNIYNFLIINFQIKQLQQLFRFTELT